MGTNFYLAIPENTELLHIGKSSAGWCFQLHIMPERGINDLGDWLQLFKKGRIRNEYTEIVSAEEMASIITRRSIHDGVDWDDRLWGVYPGQEESEEEFHKNNNSERGPNGLARCKVDGTRCVKHGEGSWDCIIGNFS